jgi:hypothetical protein
MWCYTACVQHCFTALTEKPEAMLSLDVLANVLGTLPPIVHSFECAEQWQNICTRAVCAAPAANEAVLALVLHMFRDVHALLTGTGHPQQLQNFTRLPFSAIKAWVSSDDLLVDCEDSVAVALGSWLLGSRGSKCSRAERKELCDLLRVGVMSASE